MDLETFFALQRGRVVSSRKLDEDIRHSRFKNAPKRLGKEERTDVREYSAGPHYDSIKAGYAMMRMLYV